MHAKGGEQAPSLRGAGEAGTEQARKKCSPPSNYPSCAAQSEACDEEDVCASLLVRGCESCALARYPEDGSSTAITFKATLADFRFDKFEVTVDRFRRFVENYPQSRPKVGSGRNFADPADQGWRAAWDQRLAPDASVLSRAVACNIGGATWTPTRGPNESKPVNCVTWYEAFAFCIWDGGRLPTEVEWYYAATGGDDFRRYPWGEEAPDTQLAVYNSCDKRDVQCILNLAPVRVGSRPSGIGRWGQTDLVGSVDEWARDTYSDAFPVHDPCNNCANLAKDGASDASVFRLTCGANWLSRASLLPLSKRRIDVAVSRQPTQRFRCARSP